MTGVLNIDEASGKPSYDIGAVEKIYGTYPNDVITIISNVSTELIDEEIYNRYVVGGVTNNLNNSLKYKVSILRKKDQTYEGTQYLEFSSNTNRININEFLEEIGLINSLEESLYYFDVLTISNYIEGSDTNYILLGISIRTSDSSIDRYTLAIGIKEEVKTVVNEGNMYIMTLDKNKIYITKDGISGNCDFALNQDNKYIFVGDGSRYIGQEILSIYELSDDVWTDTEDQKIAGRKSIVKRSNFKTNIPSSTAGFFDAGFKSIYSFDNEKIVVMDGFNESTAIFELKNMNIEKGLSIGECLVPFDSGNKLIDNTGKIYSVDYSGEEIEITEDRTLSNNPVNIATTSNIFRIINRDGNLMYQIERKSEQNKYLYKVYVYTLDIEKEELFEFIRDLEVDSLVYNGYEISRLSPNGNTLFFAPSNNRPDLSPNKVVFAKPQNDFSKVIGLKYENEYYYKTSLNLTATPDKVLNGYTYIGSTGNIEKRKIGGVMNDK